MHAVFTACMYFEHLISPQNSEGRKEMLKKIWDHLEEYFLIPTLIFSVMLIFAQVVMRYVFSNSLSWSEELARYLFLWQSWIGVSYGVKKNMHLRILILPGKLKGRAKDILEIIVNTIWFAFGTFMIFKGFELAMMIASRGQASAALRLPMQIAYLSVPVGCLLMNLRLIESTVMTIRGQGRGEATSDGI